MSKHDAVVANTSGPYELVGPRAGAPTGKYMVREASSGRLIEIRGAGSMKDAEFEIDESIDLSKPIAEQALKKPARKTAGKK